MEHKGLLLSALGVGVGLGLGLRLASGQSSVVKRIGSSPDLDGSLVHQIEYELIKQLIDGRRSNLTFDDFPYYIRNEACINNTRLTVEACSGRLLYLAKNLLLGTLKFHLDQSETNNGDL